MYKKLAFILLLSFLPLLGGCIREDMAECIRGLRLNYSYVLNTENKCLLTEKVKSINAYIFDENTQLLVKVVALTPDDLNRKWIDIDDLPPGTYTISSWGSSSRDMEQGGFIDGDMTNPATSAFTAHVAIGRTTIDNFRIMLATKAHQSRPGDVSPIVEGTFDDLYFGLVKHVEIVEGEQRIADVAMIKDTSTLHFKVTGWDSLNSRAGDTREPLIYVAGHNERYSFDNSIDSYAREVCYESYHQSEEGNVVSADIRVMHLDIDRFKNQPIWLHIQDAATGTDIIPDIDIINNVILKAKDAQGRLLWPDQESIDRTNEFWIDLSVLANLDISITVNGFEVIYADPNIDRP